MASRFYGLNHGQHEVDVTDTSTTTASTAVEVRVDLAKITYKQQAYDDLIYIANKILQSPALV